MNIYYQVNSQEEYLEILNIFHKYTKLPFADNHSAESYSQKWPFKKGATKVVGVSHGEIVTWSTRLAHFNISPTLAELLEKFKQPRLTVGGEDIEIKDGKFELRRSVVTKRDVAALCDYLKKDTQQFFKFGDKFKSVEEDIYMLCSVAQGLINLITMEGRGLGSRISEPVEVKSPLKVTFDELRRISNIRSWSVQRDNKWVPIGDSALKICNYDVKIQGDNITIGCVKTNKKEVEAVARAMGIN